MGWGRDAERAVVGEGSGWTEVTTFEQLEQFLDMVGSFHDGIVKEVHWVNLSKVDENLSMYPYQLAGARMLVQRQWKDPSAVELIFEDVLRLELESLDLVFGSDAAVKETQDADQPGPSLVLQMENSAVTFRRMRWRDASEWMGGTARFGLPVDGWHRGGAESSLD